MIIDWTASIKKSWHGITPRRRKDGFIKNTETLAEPIVIICRTDILEVNKHKYTQCQKKWCSCMWSLPFRFLSEWSPISYLRTENRTKYTGKMMTSSEGAKNGYKVQSSQEQIWITQEGRTLPVKYLVCKLSLWKRCLNFFWLPVSVSS